MARKTSSGFRRSNKGGVRSRTSFDGRPACKCTFFVPGRAYLGQTQCVICGGLRKVSIIEIRKYNSRRQSPRGRLAG